MRCTYLLAGIALLLLEAIMSDAAPAFRVGVELPTNVPAKPGIEHALREMGVQYINAYVFNGESGPRTRSPELTARMVSRLAENLGIEYQLACHHKDVPVEAIRAVADDPRFRGVLIDELEHIRLLWRLNPPPGEWLIDMDVAETWEEAGERALLGWRQLGQRYADKGVTQLTSTHVWPVLLHTAARAGWIPCAKICKEFYSPVSLAVGMGAARQYGRECWADVDMWFWDMVPGHSPEEVWSNLLLAYWAGVDLVYLEGCGFNLYPAGRQGYPFSLMSAITDEAYQLTPHGVMLRRFIREYVPSHPRPWTHRDLLPDVAIVRFDDSDWGQGHPSFGEVLFGSERFKPDADTRAWLHAWNVLTLGTTGTDGISFFKSSIQYPLHEYKPTPHQRDSYLTRPGYAATHPFFVPFNNVVVYDHLASEADLAGVPCLIVTGKLLSDTTWSAIRKRVQDGAVCLLWAPLARKLGMDAPETGNPVRTDGKGRWMLVNDFGDAAVKDMLAPWLPKPDVIRYRFRQGDVVLRQVPGDPNRVTVEIDGRPAGKPD